ncbi:hypothetical protein WDA31_18530, partial [Acinetobacter nosocomialis]
MGAAEAEPESVPEIQRPDLGDQSNSDRNSDQIERQVEQEPLVQHTSKTPKKGRKKKSVIEGDATRTGGDGGSRFGRDEFDEDDRELEVT